MEPFITPWVLADVYILVALIGFVMFATSAACWANEPSHGDEKKAKRSARISLAFLVWPLVVVALVVYAAIYGLAWLVRTAT